MTYFNIGDTPPFPYSGNNKNQHPNSTFLKELSKKSFFFKMVIYLFILRDSKGGAEREGERELQAGSLLSAQNLMRGSIPP